MIQDAAAGWNFVFATVWKILTQVCKKSSESLRRNSPTISFILSKLVYAVSNILVESQCNSIQRRMHAYEKIFCKACNFHWRTVSMKTICLQMKLLRRNGALCKTLFHKLCKFVQRSGKRNTKQVFVCSKILNNEYGKQEDFILNAATMLCQWLQVKQ